jgi:hypothetical protein
MSTEPAPYESLAELKAEHGRLLKAGRGAVQSTGAADLAVAVV